MYNPTYQYSSSAVNLFTFVKPMFVDTVSEWCWFNSVVISEADFSLKLSSILCPCAEHRRGVSLLHLYGETEGCSSLPALLQTLLLQLHTSKSVYTRQGPENVLLTAPLYNLILVANSGFKTQNWLIVQTSWLSAFLSQFWENKPDSRLFFQVKGKLQKLPACAVW